jgi:hypothetical protein
MDMDVFAGINLEGNHALATAAWQYSHHVLPEMRSHRGANLKVANTNLEFNNPERGQHA